MRGKIGFTLLEILIVVIIIGILASIALPMYANIKKKAYSAEGVQGLNSLLQGELVYYQENSAFAGDQTKIAADVASGNYSYSTYNVTDLSNWVGWQATSTVGTSPIYGAVGKNGKRKISSASAPTKTDLGL